MSKKPTRYGGSRASKVLLPSTLLALPPALFVFLFVMLAYGYGTPAAQTEAQGRAEGAPAPVSGAETAVADPEPTGAEPAESKMTTVEAVTPEEILSEEERTGAPEYEDWLAESSEPPPKLVSSDSSTGALPAVKPFNFGRDPGGPEDKTLYLTVPKLGISGVPVFNSTSEEKLAEGTAHHPATGFPWQEGANTYIAGHRIGYAGTDSSRIFYDLDQLVAGDEIIVTDSAGGEYVYRVTEQVVVGPDNVEVMNAVDGESLVSLQTCTLPDYAERIVVQGELVEKTV